VSAGPAGHRRPLASRRVPSMLAPSLAASCIDVPCRDLIRRLAAENHLWGSADSRRVTEARNRRLERTVSRYLPDRLTPPSQTWRTCLTNHLGDLAFVSPMTSSYESGDDDVADVLGSSFRPALLSRDAPYASSLWAVVDYLLRFDTRLLAGVTQDSLHDLTGTRPRSGRDPPTLGRLQMVSLGARSVHPRPPSGRCGQ
jgi:hypothetical protein